MRKMAISAVAKTTHSAVHPPLTAPEIAQKVFKTRQTVKSVTAEPVLIQNWALYWGHTI